MLLICFHKIRLFLWSKTVTISWLCTYYTFLSKKVKQNFVLTQDFPQ